MSSNAVQSNAKQVFYGHGALFDIKQVHCDTCWSWLKWVGFLLQRFLFWFLHRCQCQHDACSEVAPEGKSLRPSCVTRGGLSRGCWSKYYRAAIFFKLWWKPHLTQPCHPNSVSKPHLNFELIAQTQLAWLAVLLWILQIAVISIGKRGCRILLNTCHFCQLAWSQHHHL